MAIDNMRYAVVNRSSFSILVYEKLVPSGAFTGGTTAGGNQIGVIYPNEFYTVIINISAYNYKLPYYFPEPTG